MSEIHRPSPEIRIEKNAEQARNVLREFLKSIERSGFRILKVLGPAAVLSSSAFAKEPTMSVIVSDTPKLQCDVAWMNAEGEKIGTTRMLLPDVSTFASASENQIHLDFNQVGGCQDAVPVGVLSAKKAVEAGGSIQDSSKNEQRLLDVARTVVRTASDHAYTGGMLGGDAYGWRFRVDTSESRSEVVANHHLDLTTALVVNNGYGAAELLKGKPPELQGVYLRVNFTPKK